MKNFWINPWEISLENNNYSKNYEEIIERLSGATIWRIAVRMLASSWGIHEKKNTNGVRGRIQGTAHQIFGISENIPNRILGGDL